MADSRLISIYDTTLRDGSQGVGISFSLQDKLNIARELDKFHVDYIEGGWPGSNPKDSLFFEEVKKLNLQNSKIAAFSSTKRPRLDYADDQILQALVNCGADVLTIFAKTWDFHVTKALNISLEENLELIYGTVAYLKDKGYMVFVDGEHFFDGYKANPDYALKTLEAAKRGGADMLVLCDTNGGSIPSEVENITGTVARELNHPLGIHTHNDSGMAVANSMYAVSAGAVSVQGTINGIGERCGNCDLTSLIPNLLLKMGFRSNCSERLEYLTEISRYVSETANIRHNEQAPFVGDNAFAHKGGIHVSALNKDTRTYEHISPELVGNHRKVTISELSGKSNIIFKANELGIDLEKAPVDLSNNLLKKVKELEDKGFQFEAAEGSFELLIRESLNEYHPHFELKGFRIHTLTNDANEIKTEATIKVAVNGIEEHTASDGNGPVQALDNALRKALVKFYPQINDLNLVDYKVRVIDEKAGTGSQVRVLMEHKCQDLHYGTVGVSENIIEASWKAMVDGIEFMLLKQSGRKGD